MANIPTSLTFSSI